MGDENRGDLPRHASLIEGQCQYHYNGLRGPLLSARPLLPPPPLPHAVQRAGRAAAWGRRALRVRALAGLCAGVTYARTSPSRRAIQLPQVPFRVTVTLLALLLAHKNTLVTVDAHKTHNVDHEVGKSLVELSRCLLQTV